MARLEVVDLTKKFSGRRGSIYDIFRTLCLWKNYKSSLNCGFLQPNKGEIYFDDQLVNDVPVYIFAKQN